MSQIFLAENFDVSVCDTPGYLYVPGCLFTQTGSSFIVEQKFENHKLVFCLVGFYKFKSF